MKKKPMAEGIRPGKELVSKVNLKAIRKFYNNCNNEREESYALDELFHKLRFEEDIEQDTSEFRWTSTDFKDQVEQRKNRSLSKILMCT
jgi:hypothetical protein